MRRVVRYAIALVAACGFERQVPSEANEAADAPAMDSPGADAPGDTIENPCPTSYDLTFGTHRYRVTATGTRANVAAACASEGQHMVAIETMEENEFVRSTLAPAAAGGSYFWIGLSWSGSGWVWEDGSSLGAYENFSGPAPSGSSNPCVDVSYATGTWNAYQCSAPPHDSLCECDGT